MIYTIVEVVEAPECLCHLHDLLTISVDDLLLIY